MHSFECLCTLTFCTIIDLTRLCYVGLLCDICSTCTPGSLTQVLLLLSHLASSQESFVSVPSKAFDFLARLPNIVPELGSLTKKIPSSRKFGYYFFLASIERALKTDTQVYDGIVKSVQLGDHASEASASLLNIAKQPLEGDEMERLVQMLKYFDLYNSNATDTVINEFLSENNKDSQERANVLAVVGKSLEATVRAPLADANVTLASGIDHSSPSIRITALEKLNEICSSEDALKGEAEIILKNGLHRRLQDDDISVVVAVLGLSQLSRLIPDTVLTEHLIQCINRCIELIYAKTSTKRMRSLARIAAKSALSLLPAVSKDQILILGTLMSVLLTSMGSFKVSLEALRILGEYNSPLSGCCASLDITEREHSKSHNSKRTRKSDQHLNDNELFDVNQYNRDVIDGLSSMALKDANVSQCLFSILYGETASSYAKASILCIFENIIANKKGKKDTKRDVIAVNLVKWFFKGCAWAANEKRKTNKGSKSSWNHKADSLIDQTLVDIATRKTNLYSIEPEVMLLLLQNLSKENMNKLEEPTSVELYAYLASLPTSVWEQHMNIIVQNMENPVVDLSRIWREYEEDHSNGIVTTAALDQWTAFVSSKKLAEAQKKVVFKNISGLLHVMSSSVGVVRAKGLECCHGLQTTIASWWPAKVTVPKDTILSLLEACTKSKEKILQDSDGIEHLLQQLVASSPPTSRKRAKSPRASESRPVFLDPEGLASFLIMELADTSSSNQIGLIPLLIRVLEVSSESNNICSICSELLDKLFYDIEKEEFDSSLDSIQSRAALEMINAFKESALYNSKSKNPEQILQSTILAARWKFQPELREAALRALVNSASVSADRLGDIICILMIAASSESEEGCRNAALETLDRIKIHPEILLPFLELSSDSGHRKKKKSSETSNMTADSSINLCLHALELLQWKKDIQMMHTFVKPIQRLIKQFVALLQDGKNAFSDDSSVQGPAISAYGLRLCLDVLLDISENDTEGIAKHLFDTAVIVDCAGRASDHAVRTAALELLRSRIDSNPEDAMDHIIKTVETICTVVLNEQDKYSTALAAKVMSTAAAAWMNGGQSIHELVSNVIDAIKGTSISKQYAILGSIVDSMPGNAPRIAASITYHLLLSNDSSDTDSWKQDAALSMISKVRVNDVQFYTICRQGRYKIIFARQSELLMKKHHICLRALLKSLFPERGHESSPMKIIILTSRFSLALFLISYRERKRFVSPLRDICFSCASLLTKKSMKCFCNQISLFRGS